VGRDLEYLVGIINSLVHFYRKGRKYYMRREMKKTSCKKIAREIYSTDQVIIIILKGKKMN